MMYLHTHMIKDAGFLSMMNKQVLKKYFCRKVIENKTYGLLLPQIETSAHCKHDALLRCSMALLFNSIEVF